MPRPNPAAFKETAEEAYARNEARVHDLLHQLKTKLIAHRSLHLKDPKNWGLVGDLAHINEVLCNVVEHSI